MRLAGIDVLVGFPSSDLLWSGGLPLLLEEQKVGMAQMYHPCSANVPVMSSIGGLGQLCQGGGRGRKIVGFQDQLGTEK